VFDNPKMGDLLLSSYMSLHHNLFRKDVQQ
jgi:hypothetical protein